MSEWDGLLAPPRSDRELWLTDVRAAPRRLRLRLRRPRHVVVSAAMVLLGMCGLLAGAWFVGWWLFGLTLMAESGAVAWAGLMRDDGSGRPVVGVPTAEDIHERERMRMTAEDEAWRAGG